MTNMRFTDEMNGRQAARVVDVLRSPRLWIPTDEDYGVRHEQWVERTEADLLSDTKHALLALHEAKAVGAVIFRPSPDQEAVLDIRNISIHPSARGRKFGSFILRNAEFIGRERYPELKIARVDTKLTNTAMIGFLLSQGYELEDVVELYADGKPDAVLMKRFEEAAA